MKINYGNLLAIIVEIQDRYNKPDAEHRLYYDGVNVMIQPLISKEDEKNRLGNKIILTKEKLKPYIRKIMDKKPDTCLKMAGEERLNDKQVNELAQNLIMYCMEHRSIQLDKIQLKEIRGINKTQGKPFFDIDFTGETVNLNYQLTKGVGGDPEYIKNILDEIFTYNKEALTFIYDFIYQYVTEYRSAAKATIILKGGRAMGKNVFVDIMGSFFDGTSVRKHDNSRFNSERLNAKIIYKDESEESKEGNSNFKDLEKMAKESSGSEWQEIERKGKDKIIARSTYYLIILSNNDSVMTISEKPVDTRNNQFFVWDFETKVPLSTRIAKNFPDMDFYGGSGLIKKNARAFLDKYILNDIAAENGPSLRSLDYKGYRYGIPVPITRAELQLAEDTKTKADRSFEMMIELIVNKEFEDKTFSINDLNNLLTEPDKNGNVFIFTFILNAAARNNDSLETKINIKSVIKYCNNNNIEFIANKSKYFRPSGAMFSVTKKGIFLKLEDLKKVFSYLKFDNKDVKVDIF